MKIVVTERYRSFTTGRTETWAARSDDGLWTFQRLETTGTPWLAVYEPVTGWSSLHGSLKKAAENAPRQLGRDLGIAFTHLVGATPRRAQEAAA